jgi:hypothetical protein
VWHSTKNPVKTRFCENRVKIMSDVGSTKYDDFKQPIEMLPNKRTERKKAVSFRDLTVISHGGAVRAKQFHQVRTTWNLKRNLKETS